MPRPRRGSPAYIAGATVLVVMSCGGEGATAPDPPPPPPPDDPSGEACAATSSDGEWLWVDVAEGQKPELTLDALGEPRIAFMWEAEPGWVKHTRIRSSTGRPTAPETVAEGYFYGPFDMVSGARTFISYHDHEREDQVVAVQDFDGSWTLDPVQRPGHDGWHSAAAIDPNGTLHTVTIDPAAFGGDGVVYARRDNDEWAIEVAAPGGLKYDTGLSMAVPDGDTPHVVYFDADAGVAKLVRRSGPGSWEESTVEAIPPGLVEAGRFPQVAAGADGTLHVAYLARPDSRTEGSIRYAHGAFGDLEALAVADFDDILVDETFDVRVEIHGARNIVDLDFATDGSPVLAWQSRSVTYVGRWNGSGFDVEALPAPDGVELRQQISMAVDGQDRIHLAYWIHGEVGQVCYARSAV